MFSTVCRRMTLPLVLSVAVLAFGTDDTRPANPGAAPAEFNLNAADHEVVLVRDGKRFRVDLDAGTVTQEDGNASGAQTYSSSASVSSPVQGQSQTQSQPTDTNAKYYTLGDVRMVTLPTTKTLPKHGLLVDFTHRFPFQPTFSGKDLGHSLGGLDSYAVASFGFDYGISDRVSVGVFRSPTIIDRALEFKAGVKLADEKNGNPFNALFRFTVAGLNDFTRDYTESFELIASKSLGKHAQLEVVPTVSVHNRPIAFNLLPQPCGLAVANGFNPALRIQSCSNTFSIGVGLSLDVRPTLALLFEADPTAVGGPELGIHHAPYSIGIQKKIWRHAFTFGFTNSPGVTTAQRIFPRSVFVQDPNADGRSALFIGFNLTRQLR